MTPSTYYIIASTCAIVGLAYKPIKDALGYLRTIRDGVTSLSLQMNLVMTNHLPHVYERLGHIEEILIKRD